MNPIFRPFEMMEQIQIMTNETFGAHFFHTETPAVYESGDEQLYFFQAYIGDHELQVSRGDSVYWFEEDLKSVRVARGPIQIHTKHLATVVRGYMHPPAQISLSGVTTLPYVNGCSTKQLFPPLRLGDPTLQYLHMPPFSKEQEHHIHSTFRVVLITQGTGKSIVGLDDHHVTTDLIPGSVCILEPMCPHHFETPTEQPLVAVPLHVFSSVGPQERNHPMFNGTIRI
ncbi:AraC family ligand binding domain-containing protein [Pontibacter sp. G13]|uniref:AraC family ligand binding domain-containing protein n=1 Tax=Pontibacter sp. G13 TaxID=3074898 RepID=UPI002889F87B|nr:AraC family ligand binding domain-containing protein [Pontibacter sp. G13]WNJ18386.1 AraC family ligand binding domain-containing protein [Pontibacter sp. G13]